MDRPQAAVVLVERDDHCDRPLVLVGDPDRDGDNVNVARRAKSRVRKGLDNRLARGPQGRTSAESSTNSHYPVVVEHLHQAGLHVGTWWDLHGIREVVVEELDLARLDLSGG